MEIQWASLLKKPTRFGKLQETFRTLFIGIQWGGLQSLKPFDYITVQGLQPFVFLCAQNLKELENFSIFSLDVGK